MSSSNDSSHWLNTDPITWGTAADQPVDSTLLDVGGVDNYAEAEPVNLGRSPGVNAMLGMAIVLLIVLVGLLIFFMKSIFGGASKNADDSLALTTEDVPVAETSLSLNSPVKAASSDGEEEDYYFIGSVDGVGYFKGTFSTSTPFTKAVAAEFADDAKAGKPASAYVYSSKIKKNILMNCRQEKEYRCVGGKNADIRLVPITD